LETPRYSLDRLDATFDRVFVDSERVGGRGRGECVLDVESPLKLDVDVADRVVRAKCGRVRDLGRQAGTVFIAGVDHRALRLSEQALFCREVLLHRAVE